MSARATCAVRAAWGATLVTAPGRVLRPVSPHPPGAADRLVVRVLGLRHLAQAAVTAAVPSPPVLWLGAATDGLHAASAAVLAVADRQWRRAGTADAALAGAFGVLSALAARSPRS